MATPIDEGDQMLEGIGAILGWIIAAGGLSVTVAREFWQKNHQRRQLALESRQQKTERESATVEQLETLARELRADYTRLRSELSDERAARQQDQEKNSRALGRQGKALTRVQTVLRSTRDRLVDMQQHLILREEVIAQRWPEGRPEWIPAVPEGTLDPIDNDDEDYND